MATDTETMTRIAQEWEQFKGAHTEMRNEMAKYGTVSAETQAKVDAVNAAIETLQGSVTQRIDALENRANRPQLGGAASLTIPSDRLLLAYARWTASVHGGEVDPDRVNLDEIRAYNRAFRDFMRRGDRCEAEHWRILNEMSAGSAPDGGFWVSPDMTGRTVEFIYETSPMRQYASVQEISTGELQGDYDLDEAGTGGWVGETAARPGNTDTPQLGGWSIRVHEQYAEPRATQIFLDDARINVEDWLARKVAARFARVENTAFVNGTGVNQPRGFTTYPAGTPAATNMATWAVIQQVASGAAAALTADGLINLVYSLKSQYRSGAIFGMNRTTERDARLLTDGNGNYFWLPDFSRAGAATLLGHPVVEMPDMPNIAAGTEPIVFGNLREAYQIVDHAIGISVLRDPYTLKGRVKFYTRKRVGGDVINFEAIALQTIAAS